ncbi:hypothetical protein EY643_16200 [Halioglobus maricola]|uniref:CENP-V/GFA domain-containing protein n=1 Tax=Halioglobus maricola TaxID=2601894 RepID=A0A5P9NQD2_9GAMM|nr:GFA family protein [Halioglobus maricola]QFU77068.1 hypothetical protein EY643_16200 [Halioglobus maricola]
MKKASCQCGQLTASCPDGYLMHVQCSCVDCQRRTGTPSSFQVWYKASEVQLSGKYKIFERAALSGNNLRSGFCPNCGTTLFVEPPMGLALFDVDVIQIAVGCFFDPEFDAPEMAVWTRDMPEWIQAAPLKEFQYENQGESLEAIKEDLAKLGRL